MNYVAAGRFNLYNVCFFVYNYRLKMDIVALYTTPLLTMNNDNFDYYYYPFLIVERIGHSKQLSSSCRNNCYYSSNLGRTLNNNPCN